MSQTLKLIIVAGVALVLGFAGGYALGLYQKASVDSQLEQTQQKTTTLEGALQGERSEREQLARQARATEQVLATRVALLNTLLELTSNNFGLASQHLAQARGAIKSAEKALEGEKKAQVAKLYEKIADAQTLAMRLDPMARVTIEQILDSLKQLPGGK